MNVKSLIRNRLGRGAEAASVPESVSGAFAYGIAGSDTGAPGSQRRRESPGDYPYDTVANPRQVTRATGGISLFLNRDPIGEQGGANLYAFVGNDPVNRWDYLGLILRSAMDAVASESVGYEVAKDLGWLRTVGALRAAAGWVGAVVDPGRAGGGASYDQDTRTVYVDSATPPRYEVLHEMVHVHNHFMGGPYNDARADEGMAYVVQHSGSGVGSPIGRLRELEDEIKGVPAIEVFEKINSLERQWNWLWTFWGQPEYYSVRYESRWRGWRTVTAEPSDFRNVESHLGFRLSCSTAADTLNNMLPSCIRFTCNEGMSTLSGAQKYIRQIPAGVEIHSVFR